MTNLIEKLLLLGFGIFTLIIFISFTVPIFKDLESINIQQTTKYNEYIQFRMELESSLAGFHNKSLYNLETKVKCPGDLNISFKTKHVSYQFLIFKKVHIDYYEIDGFFITKVYINLEPVNYVVNLSLINSSLLVDFSKYEN